MNHRKYDRKSIGMAVSALLLMALLLMPCVAVEPSADSGKRTITIGYCGEEYTTFTQILSGVCTTMYADGMLRQEPPKGFSDAKACWDFIGAQASNTESVIFDPQAFFNLAELSAEQQAEVIRQPKADLMIVMGSMAAKLFVNGGYTGDYIVAGANNAVGLGVVKSASDSGSDHRCAAIYDDVYTRQVQSVCRMFSFQRMGVVYENSQTAFEYSGIPELRKQSAEKGFTLVEKNLNEPVRAELYPQYLAEIKKLYQEMAQQVDIFYLTINQIRSEDLQDVLTPFYDRRIPVISQQGSQEVQSGALFGISMTDERNYGALLMDMLTDYLSGQPMRYMSRVFHSAPKVFFNLSVAEKIHYPLDFKTMLICDAVYETTEKQSLL